MYTTQRVIKGLAIAFAIMLVGAILSGMVGVIMLVGEVFGDFKGGNADDLTEIAMSEADVKELYIEVERTAVEVVEGERFEILTSDDELEFEQKNGQVYIKKKEHDWVGTWNSDRESLKIVVPKKKLSRVVLKVGAGGLKLDKLTADEIEMSLGVGKVEIGRLKAVKRAKIDGGAGVFELRSGELNNLDFEMGVGKTELKAKLLGRSKIDGGVGPLSLTLVGSDKDYKIEVEQGIGGLTTEGFELSELQGENLVEIDGGVGALNLALASE